MGAARRLHNDKRRPLQELLIEQMECADILLINKTDTVSDDNVAACERYLHSLNPSAEIWQSCHGVIDVDKLMQRARYSADQTRVVHNGKKVSTITKSAVSNP